MIRVPIKVMFLGNRRIAWEVLKLLYTEPHRSRFDVRAIVSDRSICQKSQTYLADSNACYISSDQRQSELIRQTIKEQAIDVLISIQYNWIIPGDVLDLVNRQAFNLHNARLPDYKGYNSISHAIANHDKIYDTTIHWMTDEVDSGDLAYVRQTPIRCDDTAVSLYIRTIDAAVSAATSLLEDLGSGVDLPRAPMAQILGAFYSRDSVDLLANITDKVSPAYLARIARAAFFPPHNAAYFVYEGKKYLLLPEAEAAKIMIGAKAVNEPPF